MAGIFDMLKEAKETINNMNATLEEKPDEKLIKGYKDAMKDYKDTGNEHCLRAAEIIKKEIDRRGISVE